MPSDKARFRLPKSIVLKKSSEIKSVLDRGARASGRNVTIFRMVSPEKRFAVLIHRRVGNAVRRNRLKRLVREFYRTHPENFDQSKTIIYVRKFQANVLDLEREIRALLKKL